MGSLLVVTPSNPYLRKLICDSRRENVSPRSIYAFPETANITVKAAGTSHAAAGRVAEDLKMHAEGDAREVGEDSQRRLENFGLIQRAFRLPKGDRERKAGLTAIGRAATQSDGWRTQAPGQSGARIGGKLG